MFFLPLTFCCCVQSFSFTFTVRKHQQKKRQEKNENGKRDKWAWACKARYRIELGFCQSSSSSSSLLSFAAAKSNRYDRWLCTNLATIKHRKEYKRKLYSICKEIYKIKIIFISRTNRIEIGKIHLKFLWIRFNK